MADHVEDDSETPLLDSPSAHVQPPDGAISSSYVKECCKLIFKEYLQFLKIHCQISMKLDSIFRKRARYYIPSLAWIPSYNVSVNLRHDIVAGVTVAFLIVPQSLSYATGLVKIPAVYGLYTCFPMIIYSLLGTSRCEFAIRGICQIFKTF